MLGQRVGWVGPPLRIRPRGSHERRAEWARTRVRGDEGDAAALMAPGPWPKRESMTNRDLGAAAEAGRSVDAYISSCPPGVRTKLRQLRSAIRAVAPAAGETTRYFGIPGYFYPGFDYNGMFVWFSFKDSAIRLHLRPPTIWKHRRELAAYRTTKAIVEFPADEVVPWPLVKRLVRASIAAMRSRS